MKPLCCAFFHLCHDQVTRKGSISEDHGPPGINTSSHHLRMGQIVIQMERAMNRIEPWKIAVIVVSVIAGLAFVIGLITFFLCHDQDRYYNATFLITNVKYDPQYKRQTTEEYRHLSQEIETMISAVFKGSFLRKRYLRSHVVSLSPDPDGVLASVVLVFKFASADSKAISWGHVNSVLRRSLKTSSTYLDVDQSTLRLTELNKEKGDNLLNNCCGIRRQAFSFTGVERIIGGQRAQEGEWPWQASIQLDGTHRCGASVISNTWLVTAAHCFRGGRDPWKWTASFGIRLRPPKQKKLVRRIIIHEKYNDFFLNHEYDVAVVELTSAIEFTSDVHSVCLPEASHIFPDNTSCFVTGWGALKNDGYSVNQLRQAEVKIISTATCNRRQVYGGAITPGMLCAGYLEGQVDACQGDSGGPLVHADSRGIWYLVGIVSWGDECGKPNKPGVYTRVTYYRNWINAKTGI
ncbi:transmembrane protease serine 11E-like isoform X1 [Accipiter gentilis]|uniref:transmembrane protease serine 11E-like isoform X1 n=2 Tax=Astur gentilis TaxID=8957 RepID=UPI00210F90FB|nr:transmembrane protease serine 11E-like isoform X1 [Accipiter gentilis]